MESNLYTDRDDNVTPAYEGEARPCGQGLFVGGQLIGTCARDWGTEHDHSSGPQLVELGGAAGRLERFIESGGDIRVLLEGLPDELGRTPCTCTLACQPAVETGETRYCREEASVHGIH